MNAEPLLSIRDLTKTFGGVRAVDGIDLEVPAGEITALIGPNGAGKTTLFNLLCGVLEPTAGSVMFAGQDVTGAPPHRLAALGIARTFQNLELFADLSVADTLRVGAHRHLKGGVISAALRLPRFWSDERAADARASAALERFGLSDHAERPATALPYGLQRRVELARAVAAEPRLLLLDEPMAGLSGAEASDVGHMIRGLVDEGLTVLLVEHHMVTVMRISDTVVVLNFGELLAAGKPEAIQADPAVIAAYLGDDESAEAPR
jgi:ABC-type branched-subunit amino acid transport system ATPase component